MFAELIAIDIDAPSRALWRKPPDTAAASALVQSTVTRHAHTLPVDVYNALRMRGTNMQPVHTTRLRNMNATFMTLLTEMGAAEQTHAPGDKKHQLVIQALEAAGWVDDSNRADVSKYINIVAWIAKRPELLNAINHAKTKCASSKCCIST